MAATETSTRAAATLDDLYRHHVGESIATRTRFSATTPTRRTSQTIFVNALRALERGETPRNASSWLISP
jgi:hypothetical protein